MNASAKSHEIGPSAPCATRRQFLCGAAMTCLASVAAKGRAAEDNSGTPPVTASPASHEAAYYTPLDDKVVRCDLCPRHCRVPDGGRGYCRVRENRGGRYFTLVHSRPCAINLDPIEKKPLFHVFPGTKAYSLGTVGCNLHCKFCQNWDISQAKPEAVSAPLRTPGDVANAAVKAKARTLAFTYSEPIVFYEFMADCAKAAKAQGIDSIVVSNGFINEKPLNDLLPHVKAIKIDLKAFTQSFYGDICDGVLQPVLDTIKRIAKSKVWLEIVCLLIPTLNDNPDDLRKLAAWIVKEAGPHVPLHFTRYQPLYQLRNLPPTPPATLLRARELAMKEGCQFVYTGNVPGLAGQDTICPSCGTVLIRRYSYVIEKNSIRDGQCPACHKPVPGCWKA